MGDNLITGYQYWFNNTDNQATLVKLDTPTSPAFIDVQLPLDNPITKATPETLIYTTESDGTQMVGLKNALFIRFEDTRGQFSEIQTDSFVVSVGDMEVDYTAFIKNPDASEGKKNWTIDEGYISIERTDHYSGQNEPYFRLHGQTTMKQTISGLPAGSYTILLMGRVSEGGEADIRANGNNVLVSEIDWSQHLLVFSTDGSPFDLEITCYHGILDVDDLILTNTVERSSLTMMVTDPQGRDLTPEVTIRWYDADGVLLGTGSKISEVKKNEELFYSIELNEELGRQYREVERRSVIANTGHIVCKLEYIGQTWLRAHVVDSDTKQNLPAANVSIYQWLNGRYDQQYVAQTDEQGRFEIKVSDDSTIVIISYDGYIDKQISYSAGASGDLGDVAMTEASGLIIIPDLTYQPVVYAGEESQIQSWYSDPDNVSYSLTNTTKNVELQTSIQHGVILTVGSFDVGDHLKVTATSKDGSFATLEKDIEIQQMGEITVPMHLVERGGFMVTYGKKCDEESLAMVFNTQGVMVQRSTFSTSSTAFMGLEADRYQLLTMGYDGTMGTISNLADINMLGLENGVDYVSTTLEVRDGYISIVEVDSVPEMDRAKFSYTSDNTSYLPNKSQFVAGSFVTLTGRVDFKTQYNNAVDNVLLTFDIPEGCVFIDNSVIIGTRQAAYSISNNKLTIALQKEDLNQRVRFCLTPVQSGVYTSSAYATFNCNGQKTQSIGSAYFETTDMALFAPSSTSETIIPVSGIARPKALVDIYDNGSIIGTIQAQADGYWMAECKLFKPYNLSTHKIYAKVAVQNDITVTTASRECFYDINAVKVRSVLMTFYNGWLKRNVNVTFDFLRGTTSSKTYSFYKATDFTFIADLTANNSNSVRSVTFYVYTSQNEVRVLNGFFDPSIGRWVATRHFDSYNLPVNLMVDIDASPQYLADRNELDEKKVEYQTSIDQDKSLLAELSAEYDAEIDAESSVIEQIQDLLNDEDSNSERLQALWDSLRAEVDGEPEMSDAEFEAATSELFAESAVAEKNFVRDSLFSHMGLLTGLRDAAFPSAPYSAIMDTDGGDGKTIAMEVIHNIDVNQLLAAGYEAIQTTSGNNVYYLLEDQTITFVDVEGNVKYTQSFYNNSSTPSNAKARIAESLDRFEAKAAPIISRLEDIKNLTDKLNAISCKTIEGSIAYIQVMEELNGEVYNLYIAIYNYYHENFLKSIADAINLCDAFIVKDELLYEESIKRLLKAKDLHEANPNDMSLFGVVVQETIISSRYKINIRRWNGYKAKINQLADKIGKLWNSIPRTPKIKFNSNVAKLGGKLVGGFGILLEIFDLYAFSSESVELMKQWVNLLYLIEAKIPCPDDSQRALKLREDICNDNVDLAQVIKRNAGAKAWTIMIDGFSLAAEFVPYAALGAWFASGAFNIYTEWSKLCTIDGKFVDKRLKYINAINDLKCHLEPPEPPKPTPDPPKPPQPPFPPLTPIHDPSGFVYEAVPTNRMKDVTATIFYDDEEPKLWDASDYSQVNPIITDEDGLYAWDVPQGVWQVRFEKPGYETTKTEWMPVPPPQMEINIPMTQALAPQVEKARGTESGIWLTFSKYMMPETLNKSRIIVSRNGSNVSGEVELLNVENDPYTHREYVSKVKFVPNKSFATSDEVLVTVKKEVESYAEKQMSEDFVKRVEIEPELKTISCDSILAVDYLSETVLEVSVLPGEAAKGKTLLIETSSEIIATADVDNVVLNEEGKAQIFVNGNLPGSASLHLTIPDAELECYVEVYVVLAETTVKAPKASKRTGSMIAIDYLLELSSSTRGATIYYTLDGSNPFDVQTCLEYIGPFALPMGEVTVKAIAKRQGMNDSEVSTFHYLVSEEAGIIELWDSDRILDARYLDDYIIISGAEGASCYVFDLLGRVSATKTRVGIHDAIKVPKTDAYIIMAKWPDGKTTTRKILAE